MWSSSCLQLYTSGARGIKCIDNFSSVDLMLVVDGHETQAGELSLGHGIAQVSVQSAQDAEGALNCGC